jgi:hypothetical protein
MNIVPAQKFTPQVIVTRTALLGENELIYGIIVAEEETEVLGPHERVHWLVVKLLGGVLAMGICDGRENAKREISEAIDKLCQI